MKLLSAILLLTLLLASLVEGTRNKRVRRNIRDGSGKSAEVSKGSKRPGHHDNKDCGMKGPHKHGEDDLGIRFNKFEMTNAYGGRPVHLTWKNYPLDEDMVYKLSHYSTIASLVMLDDYEVEDICIEHYIDKIGGYPSFPSHNPRSPFWRDLGEVVEAQKLRLRGQIPSFFVLPDLWQGRTVAQVAEAVHSEFPGTNHVEMIRSFLAEGLEIDHTCTAFRSKYDYIGEDVRLAALNTWSIGVVAPINFVIKHHVGRPRPEEIAWLIYNDRLTAADGVPQSLVNDVKSFRLTSRESFTAYPEGSPAHPSWPAMHSAASSASLWLAVVANLTAEQYCQVLRTDYAVAYARTVAGVHYPSDNIAGLQLGQEVIADRLAEHLAWTYGGDPECYQEKIDRLRFQWSSYNPITCQVRHDFRYYEKDHY